MSGLPALSDNRRLRYVVFGFLYAAQGIPYGLMSIAVSAYLAEAGYTPAEVGGYMGVVLLPWSLKLINGPIMDRWSFLPMGRRRPWLLLAQTGMVLSTLAAAAVGISDLAVFTALGFTVNVFTAFQDVAVDGMAVEILPNDEKAIGNGVMWGAKVIGISGAAGAGSWLLNAFGVGVALVGQAVAIAAIMLLPLLFLERSGERMLPWTKGSASEYSKAVQLTGFRSMLISLLRVMRTPIGAVVALTFVVYNSIRGLLESHLPTFTVQELGWDDSEYASISASTSLIAGILGMLFGGLFVRKMGARGAIATLVAALSFCAVAVGVAVGRGAHGVAVQTFVGAYNLLNTFTMIAFLSVLMSISWRRIGATHFALYMAMGNMGLSAGAAMLGPVREVLPAQHLFLAIGALGAALLTLLPFANVRAQVARIEQIDAEMSSVIS